MVSNIKLFRCLGMCIAKLAWLGRDKIVAMIQPHSVKMNKDPYVFLVYPTDPPPLIKLIIIPIFWIHIPPNNTSIVRLWNRCIILLWLTSHPLDKINDCAIIVLWRWMPYFMKYYHLELEHRGYN